jgi:hypothetical protein
MPTQESKTIGISINCPWERANAFLGHPENFPQWAAGLGSGITRDGDHRTVQTPQGPATVRFTEPNPFGILDHTVVPPGGRPAYVPMRVVANGDGCEVMLTLFRSPEWSDQKFEEDVQWVERDLAALKKLLETSAR